MWRGGGTTSGTRGVEEVEEGDGLTSGEETRYRTCMFNLEEEIEMNVITSTPRVVK